MNEKLAVQILSYIREGVIGYADILIDIKKGQAFLTLKDQEFAETINELKELDCIRPLSGGHPKHFQINPDKDCLTHFSKRISTNAQAEDFELLYRGLQIENLKLSNRVLKLQEVEIKTKVLYLFIGAGATVLFMLLAKVL